MYVTRKVVNLQVRLVSQLVDHGVLSHHDLCSLAKLQTKNHEDLCTFIKVVVKK